jgi:hypothetical protein
MWKTFKNVKSGTVHAVALPSGMSPHGSAMGWALAETHESLSCRQCLQFAFQWRKQNAQLKAMLPADADGGSGTSLVVCQATVRECCC